MMQFETIQKLGRDNVEAAMTSFGALTRGVQSAAVEAAEFAKRSFEQGSSTMEKLVGARTLDSAVEIQGAFLRSSYESFVAQATRMGELAANTAKDAFAPVETLVSKNVRA